ncbi:MAG: GyrI-like domain-containing protein [Oscillospiraceae bacterium]|jgi:hypothetical protein|nr:GyrI-like domain-containing protein [Oscillospiraceae bacterium]
MTEIIKTYKETLPALRLIGKRYGNSDRDEYGGYGAKWSEWFPNGWFEVLEKLGAVRDIENGCLGFMRCDGTDENFEYWIGMFLPPGTEAPEGYEFLDLEGGDVGICWIKGNRDDGSIYGMHEKCVDELKKNDMGNFMYDEKKYLYHFERYNCPRFTEKDSSGNAILDYGIYLA